MKALVKKEAKEGLSLEDVNVPTINDDEVLIKVKKTAICGTDIHIYNWDEWASKTIKVPTTIGHEFSGVVEAKGKNVDNVELGDIVSAEGHIVCNVCRNCMRGKRHLCPNTKGIGVNRDGAFAQFVSVPSSNIWKVNKDFDLNVLACYDPFGNAVHTSLSFNLLGEDVLITGAGPIGIMGTAIASYAGARSVVVCDMNDYRLALAKKMGATRTVNVLNQNLKDVFKELDIRNGFDIGLEMSGSPKALNSMIDSMFSGGKIALLGILPNNAGINWEDVIFKAITLKGIYGREIFDTWYKMDMLIQGGLDIKPVITHSFSYKDYEEAFKIAKSSNSGKIILDWD